MNWKTIDKLEAKIPGADTYRGELCTFEVRLGRHTTPLYLSEKYEEKFRIENKQYEIAVEAPTLHEAKEKLRDLLAASDNYSGKWSLWLKIDVSGGCDKSWRGEEATCTIRMEFIAELTTKKNGNVRKRHVSLAEQLPRPFTGEYWKPTTHKELSNLCDGPAKPKPGSYSDPYDVWIEATPEIVKTVRILQSRLGESGEKVKDALSKKRFLETIESVCSGGTLLLGTGLSK